MQKVPDKCEVSDSVARELERSSALNSGVDSSCRLKPGKSLVPLWVVHHFNRQSERTKTQLSVIVRAQPHDSHFAAEESLKSLLLRATPVVGTTPPESITSACFSQPVVSLRSTTG